MSKSISELTKERVRYLIATDKIRTAINLLINQAHIGSEAQTTSINLSGQFSNFEKQMHIIGEDEVKKTNDYKKFVGLQLTPFVESLTDDDLFHLSFPIPIEPFKFK